MEEKVYKMPSIEQFRNVIHQVNHKARYVGEDNITGEIIYDTTEGILPTLEYRGSVKLHGTNASIVYVWNPSAFEYQMQAQSKSQIITPMNDNAGFAAFAYTINSEAILSQIMKVYGDDLGYTPEVVRVYGEWCGGNIQKGVAINGLDKMFVIFAIKIDNIWLSDDKLSKIKLPDSRIYNILDYPTYSISIDFNNPKIAANTMSQLVDNVEKECPVGKAFGIENGIGEGIVWVCLTEGWTQSRYWFKTKGDEHKSSGTKEKVPIDIERVNSINDLVDNFLTESRLMQGLDQLREHNLELSKKSTGFYVKWVSDDVIKEELDTIMGNGFEPKEITSVIANKARKWFFNNLDEGIGL